MTGRGGRPGASCMERTASGGRCSTRLASLSAWIRTSWPATGSFWRTSGRLRASRELSDASHATAEISRLYVVESAMTVTGSNADHRVRLRPSAMAAMAAAIGKALNGDEKPLAELAERNHLDRKVLAALVKDLAGNKERALVVAGAASAGSGACGRRSAERRTRIPRQDDGVEPSPGDVAGEWMADLCERRSKRGPMSSICLGVNPVYDMPGTGL